MAGDRNLPGGVHQPEGAQLPGPLKKRQPRSYDPSRLGMVAPRNPVINPCVLKMDFVCAKNRSRVCCRGLRTRSISVTG